MGITEYLNNNPKKHLIFDLDLTIVELLWPKDFYEEVRSFLKNIDKNLAEQTEVLGYEGVNIMIAKYGSIFKKRLDEIYLACESERANEPIKINKEAINFIKKNENKYKFYIWSNNQKPTIERVLKKIKIEKYFNKIVSGSDVKFFKPDLEGFYRIYNKKDSKKEYLMIGDSENDKVAAKNAGIDYFYLHI